MTTASRAQTGDGEGTERLSIAKRRRPSLIWLVPLVAVGLVAYLSYGALARRGPLVTLHFKTATGVVAEQTLVTYKAVPIGTVEDVDLDADHSGAVVHVRMQRAAKFALTDHARFWVVRPRLTLANLSGLETIVSGAYITVDPGPPGGKEVKSFQGLDEPPGVTSDEPGSTFELTASRMGSLVEGAPVIYRDVTVGSLLKSELGDKPGPVALRLFVRAPYDKLVHADTLFWNASGVSLNMGPDGIHLELESLQAVLTGGIAFETPKDAAPQPIDEHTPFRLYESKAQADVVLFKRGTSCVSYFETSVQGLGYGSLVEIFGVPVGAVTEVKLARGPSGKLVARVAYDLQAERAFAPGERRQLAPDELGSLARQGMRVVLESSSLVTGQKVLSLQYVPNVKDAPVAQEGGALVLPSQAGGLDGITTALADISAKLDRIPFEEIGNNVNEILRSVNATVGSPELKEAIQSLYATMKDARHLVREADTNLTPALQRLPTIAGEMQMAVERARDALGSEGYGADSDLQRSLTKTIDQVGQTARTVRLLADFLGHHPEALLQGRAGHTGER